MKAKDALIVVVLLGISLLFSGCGILMAPLTRRASSDIRGRITAVEGNVIRIDKGKRDGLEEGMELVVVKRKDNLPLPMVYKVGKVIITDVKASTSVGTVFFERDEILIGDRVETISKEKTGLAYWEDTPLVRKGISYVAGTLASDEVWSGTVHVTDTVTVPFDATLKRKFALIFMAEVKIQNSARWTSFRF